MENKNEIKEESTKVIKEAKTQKGKRIITIQKGVSTTTRLVHDIPSHLRNEE